MIGKLVDLGSSLRFAGVPVSIPETLETASVLKDIEQPNVQDKETIRLLLQACMLKEEQKSTIFHEQFDRWWTRWFGEASSNVELPSVLNSLRHSILTGDQAEIEELFNLAMVNVSDSLEADNGLPGQGAGGGPGEGNQDGNPLSKAKNRRAIYNYLRAMLKFEELEHEITEDQELSIWHRQNARHSLNRAEALLRKSVFNSGYNTGDRHVWRMRERMKDAYEDVSDVAIYKASYTQIQKMQKIVPDIVRQLSYQKKYKDHDQKGILNLRKTVRSSLSNGGVPVDITFKRKMPKRERIAILCDLSGSVEIFSQFALQLANCFSSQFAGITCYGFISDIDDITRFVSREDFPRSMGELYSESDLVLGTSNSDYGQVFEQFVKKHLSDLAKSSSVIILGDARNNGRDPGLDALKTIRNWVKKVYWLNPEPTSAWNYGDSVMNQYVGLCDSAHYIKSVNDLAKFVISLRDG